MHASALGAEVQIHGSWSLSSQHTPGTVVLVVVLELVVVTVVTVMLVAVVTVVLVGSVVVVVTGTQSPSGVHWASATKAPPRLVHVISSRPPPMAHPSSS
jgi:hypothetical protein